MNRAMIAMWYLASAAMGANCAWHANELIDGIGIDAGDTLGMIWSGFAVVAIAWHRAHHAPEGDARRAAQGVA